MAARALYGPVRWPPTRPRDETSPLASGAALVEADKHGLVTRSYSSTTDNFPLDPWLKNNGIQPGQLGFVLYTLAGGSGTVEGCVRQTREKLEGERVVQALGDKHAHFLNIVEEARIALAAGRVPHGAVAYVQWWNGPTQYVEGRAPMAKMPNLPEDALRLVYEHLVPLDRADATAELASAQDLLDGTRADPDDEEHAEDDLVAVSPPQPGTVMLVEGDLASDGDASSYDGGSDVDEDEDDDDSGSDESDVDLDDDNNEYDLAELNERHEELKDIHRALESVDETLWYRLYQTRGLDSLNSHFRAALQRTMQIHRGRRREYADVLNRLEEYRSHVDLRRRDLGYESEHG